MGYYSKNYYYSKDYTGQAGGEEVRSEKDRIGKSLNFAAREAYKQLRTNLDFALADVPGCRCVGLTSPMRGEGKSLTSINLSYSLAEDGYKVILLECDLRLPSLGKKLEIKQKKGLTEILAENGPLTSINPMCVIEEHGGYFDIMTAGKIPPNPQEILGSSRMTEFMNFLRSMYDYIILDLPPVTVVADALVASKVVDGMLMVIRHDHSEKGALAEALRSMDFAGIRTLGFVFNAANNDDSGYSRRYKRYRYYRGGAGKGYGYYRKSYYTGDYGYGYGYGYENVQSEQPRSNKEEESDRYTHTSDTGN